MKTQCIIRKNVLSGRFYIFREDVLSERMNYQGVCNIMEDALTGMIYYQGGFIFLGRMYYQRGCIISEVVISWRMH